MTDSRQFSDSRDVPSELHTVGYRFWFYLAVSIVILGEFSFYKIDQNHIAAQQSRIEKTAIESQVSSLDSYLALQTDERKLVSLAKHLRNSSPVILKPIIDKAYALNPNSRDITLLASYFHPELKARVTELDPLYKP